MTPVIFHHALQQCFLAGISLSLLGCAGLLPDGKRESQMPWQSYAEAQVMFAQIVPQKTGLAELRQLGIDPEKTPNITLLGHADLLRRLIATSSFDISLLDPGLQECISSHQSCFGYEIEQTHLDRKRYGNFWLDFLNFRRKTDISGWQFNAIVVLKDDVVIYKLWSGKPYIHQLEEERSPLGPFQGFGPSSLLGR